MLSSASSRLDVKSTSSASKSSSNISSGLSLFAVSSLASGVDAADESELNGFSKAFAESWRVWLKHRTRLTDSNELSRLASFVVWVSLAVALSALTARIYNLQVSTISVLFKIDLLSLLAQSIQALLERLLPSQHQYVTIRYVTWRSVENLIATHLGNFNYIKQKRKHITLVIEVDCPRYKCTMVGWSPSIRGKV